MLKTADDLKIKGLAEVTWRDEDDGPPPPMPAAEFHSPSRSLAETYGRDQDMHHQQTPSQLQLQSQSQSHHKSERERERDHNSPTAMDNVLGLNAAARMPALTPLPSASAHLECPAPVDQYMGPKRKRGRPPLDDTYDVFNV